MARDKLTEYSATASENTVVGDVNIAENSALPSDMNNAVREVMSHQKEAFGSGTPLYVDQTNDVVGIGLSSPLTNYKIHVDANSDSDGRVARFSQAGTDNAIVDITAQNGTNTEAVIRYRNDTTYYSVGIDSSDNFVIGESFANDVGTKRLVIDTTGKLGVGTATPNFQQQIVYGSNGGVAVASNAIPADNTTGLIANAKSNTSSDFAFKAGSYNDGYRLLVRADGVVTMPKQPSCYVYGTNGQSIASGDNYTLCQMGTEAHDIGNNFNTSNHRFTAPVDGVYIVYYRAMVFFVPDTRVGIALRKNGANLPTDPFETASGNFDYPRLGAVKIVELNANDYLTVHVNQYRGTSQTLTNKELHVALLG